LTGHLLPDSFFIKAGLWDISRVTDVIKKKELVEGEVLRMRELLILQKGEPESKNNEYKQMQVI
jgi:hypothetical protein